MEEDFVDKEETIEKDIAGRKFQLRYLLGPEVDNIDSKSQRFSQDDSGQPKMEIDQALRNRELLKRAVAHAPYDGSVINKNDPKGVPIPWTQLTEGDRLVILDKLKPPIRSELINEVLKMNRADSEIIKK